MEQRTSFDCGLCLEQKPLPSINIADDTICNDCFESDIRPAFDKALSHENSYPVFWGGTELAPQDFRGLFTREFRRAWNAKIVEYRTPPNERVYCRHIVTDEYGKDTGECGTFICNVADFWPHHIFPCPACKGEVCATCTQSLTGSSSSHVSQCRPRKQELGLMVAFPGLERGRDIQFCPGRNCHLPVVLQDGCNSLVCVKCMKHFCFVCGTEAHHDSDHWKPGSPCPKWNQPGAENARWDAPVAAPVPGHDDLEAQIVQVRGMMHVERDRYLGEIEREWSAMSRQVLLYKVNLIDVMLDITIHLWTASFVGAVEDTFELLASFALANALRKGLGALIVVANGGTELQIREGLAPFREWHDEIQAAAVDVDGGTRRHLDVERILETYSTVTAGWFGGGGTQDR